METRYDLRCCGDYAPFHGAEVVQDAAGIGVFFGGILMTENRRQKAISWLRAEADSYRRATYLNGCDMQPEWQAIIDVCEDAIEALEAVKPDGAHTQS